jgi:ribosomal protein L10
VALTKSEKEKIVSEVKEVASKASSLVISDARGMKVSELSEVRKNARRRPDPMGWRAQQSGKKHETRRH